MVLLVALLMGFRSDAGPTAWPAAAGILLLFTVASTWLAVIPGLTAKSVDGASAFSYPLIFLPFLSSAFVPTDTMPGPLRAFAEHRPVTSIVNAIRDLFGPLARPRLVRRRPGRRALLRHGLPPPQDRP
nr:ABC transporter permease [Saccharothrix sp. 6-C]